MEKTYNFPAAQAKYEELTKDKSVPHAVGIFLTERLMAIISLLKSTTPMNPAVEDVVLRGIEAIIVAYCQKMELDPDTITKEAMEVLHACYAAANEELSTERQMSYLPANTTLQ